MQSYFKLLFSEANHRKATMHHLSVRIDSDDRVCKVALLISLACVLQIAESMIPHPVPGLRLGLANMLTLTAMVVLGFGYALEVAILRTVLSSLIMGTFMSPTFILSLSGAVVSTLAMGLFYWMSGFSRYCRMSIIGISIIGAFVHNLVQLYLAYLLLVKHAGIFIFFPWLSLGAVATGWIVGKVTGSVCLRLQENRPIEYRVPFGQSGEALHLRCYVEGDSWIHRLSAGTKLVALIISAIALLMYSQVGFYIGYTIVLGCILVITRTPISFLVTVLRKYMMLILIPFLLPLFFNTDGQALISVGFLTISIMGLQLGGLLAMRIILLILTSALLMRTTSLSQLVYGLGRLLWPLRTLGVDPHRVATLLSLAWAELPHIWKTTRDSIAALDMKKIETTKALLPLMSNLIAALYLKTEKSANIWEQPQREAARD